MSEKIEPALTAERWASRQRFYLECGAEAVVATILADEGWPGVIAFANANLDPDDPRAITRDRLHELRWALPNDHGPHEMADFVDALESYLPPTERT